MIGGALRRLVPPPMNGRNGDIRLEGPVQALGGQLHGLRALPVVHARPEHRQRRLALDQGRERQRAVVVLLDGLLQGIEVVVLIGQGVGQLVGDDRLVLVLVEPVVLAEEPLEQGPGFFFDSGFLGSSIRCIVLVLGS